MNSCANTRQPGLDARLPSPDEDHRPLGVLVRENRRHCTSHRPTTTPACGPRKRAIATPQYPHNRRTHTDTTHLERHVFVHTLEH